MLMALFDFFFKPISKLHVFYTCVTTCTLLYFRSGRTNVDPRYSIKEGVSDHNHGSWYTNQSYGPGQEGYTAQASYSSTLSVS